MLEIGDIKPDTYVTMTDNLHRIFNVGGCDPTCHCCGVKLPVETQFVLAHVTKTQAQSGNAAIYGTFKVNDDHEVMLCNKCSVEQMILTAKQKVAMIRTQSMIYHVRHGGCSIIDGKIIS